MDDSDGFRLDPVSLDVKKILNYWRVEPSSCSGGSQKEAGDPEPFLVHNQTTTAMNIDVPLLPLASQINVSNAEVTWEPGCLHRKPTDHKRSESILHIVSKAQQQKPIKKTELNLSPCRSGIMSECSAMKVQDPIWELYSQIKTDTKKVESNILAKKPSLENTSLATKAKNEIDSEVKFEDPIWACYFAKQEIGLPNIKKPNDVNLREEPVGVEIGYTEAPSSSELGSSISKEKKPSLENTSLATKAKNEIDSEVKFEDPIWACYFAKQEIGLPNIKKPNDVNLREEPVGVEIGYTEAPSSSELGSSISKKKKPSLENTSLATKAKNEIDSEVKFEDPIWACYFAKQEICLPNIKKPNDANLREEPVGVEIGYTEAPSSSGLGSSISKEKKPSLENTSLATKAKNEIDSEVKFEDPIWACYFAKQEIGLPNIKKPNDANLREEHVGVEIGYTEAPSSSELGSSILKENAVQLNLTDRLDRDKSLCPVNSEEQTVKDSTAATHVVKHETLDIKNEDPVWGNYHLHEITMDLNPKYKHVQVPIPSLTQKHQLPTSKETLSLLTELSQATHTVSISKPAIKLEQEQTMIFHPRETFQDTLHKKAKKQRPEGELGHRSGLDSLSNKTQPSVPIAYTRVKTEPQILTFSKEVMSIIIERCPLCNKSIDSHQQAQEKLPTEAVEGQGKPNKSNPWKCCVCKLTYNTYGMFRVHRRKYLSGIKCPECNRKFATKEVLESHMKTHSNEKPYTCEDCGKAFRIRGKLNVHISSCHSTKNETHCPECGKGFKAKSYLDIHMNMHTGNRPYQCTDCDASFRTPSALYTHKTIHTGQKPYCCPQCGRCFRLKGFLTVHLATHTTIKGTQHTSGKRPFKKVQEKSDSEDSSDSMSDTDSPSDHMPQSTSSRETRSQKRLKQVDE